MSARPSSPRASVSERGELHEIFGNSEGSWLCLPASGFVKMLVVQLDRDALRDLRDFKRVRESIPEKIGFARKKLGLSLQPAKLAGLKLVF
jgi:hypothetical protein